MLRCLWEPCKQPPNNDEAVLSKRFPGFMSNCADVRQRVSGPLLVLEHREQQEARPAARQRQLHYKAEGQLLSPNSLLPHSACLRRVVHMGCRTGRAPVVLTEHNLAYPEIAHRICMGYK
jgi:hypothetical protein